MGTGADLTCRCGEESFQGMEEGGGEGSGLWDLQDQQRRLHTMHLHHAGLSQGKVPGSQAMGGGQGRQGKVGSCKRETMLRYLALALFFLLCRIPSAHRRYLLI